MSNRQTRRQQSRQARKQATSYRGGRSSGGSQGGGGSGGRGSNFLSWPYLAGVAVLAAALFAIVTFLALRDDGAEGEPGEDLAPLDQALADLPLDLQNGNKLGSDDAPVKLIQYEDFQCPHCLRYTVEHETFLVEEFVKDGLLQIEFRHLPIVGLESTTAAIGASCASEQNRLWEYANRLFAIQTQDGWRADQGHFEESALLDLAGELSLDTEVFATCQGSPDSLSTVAGHMAAAQAIGFRGTPSFVINGVPLQRTPGSTDAWRTRIEEELEGEPGADSETNEPGADSETNEPGADSEANEPGADGEANEPEADAEGDDSG